MEAQLIATYIQKVAEFPRDLVAEELPQEAWDRRYRQVGRQWGQFVKIEPEAVNSKDLRILAKSLAYGAKSMLLKGPRVIPSRQGFKVVVNDLNSPLSGGYIAVAWKVHGRVAKKTWLRKHYPLHRETPQQEMERVTRSPS